MKRKVWKWAALLISGGMTLALSGCLKQLAPTLIEAVLIQAVDTIKSALEAAAAASTT